MAIKTKRKQVEQTEAKTVLEAVKDISLATVISEVNNLQITVQKTLADLGASVTNKVQQMQQLDTAIGIKEDRLQELFNIEKEGLSLDEMRAKKDEEVAVWEHDRAERNKRWQEEEAEHAKNRNRNEDNWRYEFEQKKKRTQDEFDVQIAKTKREEQLRHEALERGWVDRENALKAREQEVAALKAQVEGFDARMEAAVKQAEARGAAVVTAKYNHEIALLKKDAEAQKSVSDLRATSLNETIENLRTQVENLEKQLVSARLDAKEVANQALQSAANRQLSETLTKVVTEREPSGKTK